MAKTLGRPEGKLVLTRYPLPPAYPGLAEVPASEAAGHPYPTVILLIYASSAGTVALDRRLFLPENWFQGERRASEVAWAVPAWITYQTGLALGAEMVRAACRVFESGKYVLDDEVAAFEREWAAYCETEYCVGVGNGLDRAGGRLGGGQDHSLVAGGLDGVEDVWVAR